MSEIFLPELELFKAPSVQSAVIKSSWVEVYPTNLNLNSGAIEFEIYGTDDYIDLEKTTLTLKSKSQQQMVLIWSPQQQMLHW